MLIPATIKVFIYHIVYWNEVFSNIVYRNEVVFNIIHRNEVFWIPNQSINKTWDPAVSVYFF